MPNENPDHPKKKTPTKDSLIKQHEMLNGISRSHANDESDNKSENHGKHRLVHVFDAPAFETIGGKQGYQQQSEQDQESPRVVEGFFGGR